ncbi:hypothetical protein ACFLW8_05840 [Chloroflexota bacterium]
MHHRTDYPDRDDVNWYHKITCIKQDNGEMKVQLIPIGG